MVRLSKVSIEGTETKLVEGELPYLVGYMSSLMVHALNGGEVCDYVITDGDGTVIYEGHVHASGLNVESPAD